MNSAFFDQKNSAYLNITHKITMNERFNMTDFIYMLISINILGGLFLKLRLNFEFQSLDCKLQIYS